MISSINIFRRNIINETISEIRLIYAFYLSVLIGVVYPRHKEDRMGAEGGKGWRREPAGRNIMFSLGRDHYLAQLNKRANATGRIAHTY